MSLQILLGTVLFSKLIGVCQAEGAYQCLKRFSADNKLYASVSF